ncbi:MAG: radical SAM protein [Candidatus Odinarchaeia archaeon]
MWEIIRPDSTSVWEDREVLTRLKRYYEIFNGQKIAKFLIAKRINCGISLKKDTDALWAEHRRLSSEFKEILNKLDAGMLNFNDLPIPTTSYLDLKIELAHRILEHCHLCERRCGVNRLKGEKGFCGIDERSRVCSQFLHMGEEAPLIPSGTIFLNSCVLRCVFCQNYDISGNPEAGFEVTPKQLALIAEDLKSQGARNINWVGGDPIPHTYSILSAMKFINSNVCMLWNSNFYCSTETMELLLDVIDFWLPDMKYYSDKCAEHLSKVKNYWSVVSRNHKIAYQSVADGTAGMIIRHLVLPNHLKCCTEPILKWISENCSKALVNIMSQYRPMYLVSEESYSEINRGPSLKEMSTAYSLADKLGLVWRPVS